MIDLHFHCLPAVDDGADSLAEAIAMCRQAASDGCEAVVATPHQGHFRWPNTEPGRLEHLAAEVRAHLEGRPQLHLGGEIRIGSELEAELDDPRRAGFLPLAGSRYLLLEFSRGGPVVEAEDLVHELVLAGWRPIICHPEFYPELTDESGMAEGLVEAGATFQITAMSVTGEFGRRARLATTRLLDAGLVHFVASDAHGSRHRPPGLSAARRLIAERYGEDTATRLTRDHPLAVVRDQPLDLVPLVGPTASHR